MTLVLTIFSLMIPDLSSFYSTTLKSCGSMQRFVILDPFLIGKVAVPVFKTSGHVLASPVPLICSYVSELSSSLVKTALAG